jgi:hypothetical protein
LRFVDVALPDQRRLDLVDLVDEFVVVDDHGDRLLARLAACL